MRIAYVCADPGVPVFGSKGCSVHVQEIIRAFGDIGTTVALFAARVGGPPPAGFGHVEIHALPAIPAGDLGRREQSAVWANRDLERRMTSAGDFDLVYERYSLWSFAAMRVARVAGVPGVLEVNAPLIEEQAANRGLAHRRWAERIAWRAFHTAEVLLAVSLQVGEYLGGFGVDPERIHVVPNGVNIDRFAPPLVNEDNNAPRPVTVGFVGTLKPWHGLTILADAFARFHARVPGSRLVIVGDGPGRAALEADLERRGLADCTRFTGAIAHENMPSLLGAIDIAVAPYPALDRFYFSPLKVLEYMAAGRAIVASRIGQIEEWIEHERTGLLVAPGDAGELARAFEKLAAEPALRVRLGRAARAVAEAHHSWNQTARRILTIARVSPSMPTPRLAAVGA